MEKLLTISVAAYNVEKYLEQLLDSIIASGKMEETEVLIINDGSKDRTAEIGSRYESQYPDSIKLVDKKNGGHGSTINKGIELASGKYFKVLDGDDWVDSKGLAKLLDKLKSEDADMLVCDYQEHYENDGVVLDKTYPQFEAEKTNRFQDVCTKAERLVFHAVFFKTEILQKHHIRVDEHSFYVDTEYVQYPIPYIQTIKYFPINVYCYRLGNVGQSMSMTSLQKNINQHENVSRHLLAYYQEKAGDCSEEVRKFMSSSCMLVYNKTYEILFSFPCKRQYMERIKEFDRYIKETAPEAYEAMPAKTIRFMRKNISLLYPVTWLWFRMKNKK